MGFQLENLLRNLFMSSLASLQAATGSAEALQPERPLTVTAEESQTLAFSPVLGKKLVLKLYDKDDLIAIAHRSHRSHSSHRSHYSSQGGHASHFSHYSSSTGTSSGSGSRSSGSSSGSSTYTPPASSYPKPVETPAFTPPVGPKVYQLGERMLRKGMVGPDVTELINLLIKRNYIKTADGSKYLIGESTFDETLEKAVKLFQTNSKITSDGIVDPETVYYLKH